MTPKRIQRKRTKGWRMPEGAVNVCRPSQWGNPFRVARTNPVPPVRASMWGVYYDLTGNLIVRWDTKELAVADAVGRHRRLIREKTAAAPIGHALSAHEIRRHLAGKDLVCWCALDAICHADTLLELANP